ncbi:hypothetical protein ACFVAE_01645 [Microbacterium sp. NPDC057659]|uniref:hypothetical protein n=1 Tax=Microbacterium sp. NPDC057659 TaxID=3346198 RepID=UPI00367138C8
MDEKGDAAREFTVTLEHVGESQVLNLALGLLIDRYNLLGEIATQILALMPDPSRWRLILTGDLSATVNALDHRSQQFGYTTTRGAGYVGGLTLPQGDGTFLFILDASNLAFPPIESDSLEEVVEHALATARHLGRHEAGHALLMTRGENAEVYRELADLDPSAAGWSHIVARDIDDFRIERHVRQNILSPYSHVEGLPGALDHLSSALAAASRGWRADIAKHAEASDHAVSAFIRVIAYLSAEVGLDDAAAPVVPRLVPDKWDRYLADHWAKWSAAFHRLSPVDQPMTLDQLASTTGELCEIAVGWMSAIGYRRGITDAGELYAYWTAGSY